MQLRPLVQNVFLLGAQRSPQVLAVFLELSNGYGQMDRECARLQTVDHPTMASAVKQQLALYTRLLVHVTTAYGMSLPYHITHGIVQGGGMDPYMYIWGSLLLWHKLKLRVVRVLLLLHTAEVMVMQAQAVMDDTTVWAASPQNVLRSCV